MATLTDEQLNKVVANTLKENRPYYYNFELKQEVQISEGMEIYLILLDDKKRATITKGIQETTKKYKQAKDRDDIIAKFLINDQEYGATNLSAVDSELAEFDKFLMEITNDGYEDVIDIGVLKTTLQKSIAEKSLLSSRSLHLVIFMANLTNIHEGEKISDEIIKELDSWVAVFNEYRGI